MNVYLCGQRYFGQETLKLLLRLGHSVAGVSAPIQHADGGPDRLFALAASLGLPVHPAGRLTADTLPGGVDLIVCAHSYDFVGRKTRLRAKLGAISYHPSLLPVHRGRDAVRWAIKMGDKVTGGTVFWLGDTVDGGPVAAQDFCFIRRSDTAEKLWRRDLQPMGLRLFENTLTDISGGRLVMVDQDESLATWEPSIDRPPLYRPDLPMIGGGLDGYTVIRERVKAEA